MSSNDDINVYYPLTKSLFIKALNFDKTQNVVGIVDEFIYEFEKVKYKIFEDGEKSRDIEFNIISTSKQTGKKKFIYNFKGKNYTLFAESNAYPDEFGLEYFYDKDILQIDETLISSYYIEFNEDDLKYNVSSIRKIFYSIFDVYDESVKFLYNFFNMSNKKTLKNLQIK